MITEIGIIAGDIWHFLEGKGSVSLDDLTSSLDKSRDAILMSLGWLAREGHVVLEGGPNYKISLRKKEE